MTQAHAQLHALADHLRAIREQLLQSWKDSENGDPELTTASTASRTQFNDHMPQILDAYERRLRAEDADEKHQARLQQRENSAEHGLLRWQQGFALRETMREWGHLHLTVLQELERYALAHRSLEESVMPTARATLARLCAEGVCESATRYTHLQQAEAASRVHDFERALQEVRLLERRRAEVWREAAHDLRGAVGVITNASAIVTADPVPEAARIQFGHVLQHNVAALREMLSDLMDLARLEAGQEHRKVAAFDAAVVLKELCDSVRGLATGKNLFLKMQGPPSLPVEGDAVKVRRLVQNLVLNALKATQNGGVRVLWGEDAREGEAERHWTICVQDTGPGFDLARAAPLEQVLKQATVASQELDDRAEQAGAPGASAEPAPTLTSKSGLSSAPAVAGEGIGLSIVKRLCELLDASLELQTIPGSGTTFRVILPRHYRTSPPR